MDMAHMEPRGDRCSPCRTRSTSGVQVHSPPEDRAKIGTRIASAGASLGDSPTGRANRDTVSKLSVRPFASSLARLSSAALLGLWEPALCLDGAGDDWTAGSTQEPDPMGAGRGTRQRGASQIPYQGVTGAEHVALQGRDRPQTVPYAEPLRRGSGGGGEQPLQQRTLGAGVPMSSAAGPDPIRPASFASPGPWGPSTGPRQLSGPRPSALMPRARGPAPAQLRPVGAGRPPSRPGVVDEIEVPSSVRVLLRLCQAPLISPVKPFHGPSGTLPLGLLEPAATKASSGVVRAHLPSWAQQSRPPRRQRLNWCNGCRRDPMGGWPTWRSARAAARSGGIRIR